MAKKRDKVATPVATKSKSSFSGIKIPYLWGHALMILFIYACCTWLYGDVFQRAQQECYVSADAERMVFVLRQPLGEFYWLMRYAMLIFKNVWVGGLVLTILLVGSACCLSRILGLSRRWKLLTFLLPLATLSYLIWRGLRIYFLDEPSLVIGIPAVVFVFTALGACIASFVRKSVGSSQVSHKHSHWFPVVTMVVVCITLFSCTRLYRENDVACARMQNLMWKADWESMADEALSVSRGTRVTAAYYAVALVQQEQLLEHIFDFAFDYPQDGINLADKGQTEAGLYEADCNFYAGLVNSAYRSAMERHVMAGPSISNYKRLALCSIINGEMNLAKRYMKALEEVPFESDFVDRYGPMIDNPKLIVEDPELVKVLHLAPRETTYEQNFRRPVFLGYNVGLSYGSDQTLITSIAATLYSKDLLRFMNMASVLRQKTGGRLPAIVRQAIMIYSMTHEEVKNVFPEVCNDRVMLSNFHAFVAEAKPYLKDKAELRKQLKQNWLGTYYYYYYCENNEPYQVRKANSSAGGVN